MKKTPLLAIMAAGVLSLCYAVPHLLAQQQNPVPARQPGAQPQAGFNGKVALLDVNFVFKNHQRFKDSMTQLKNDADAMDVKMKQEEASLRKMVEGLQQFKPGSPDYKKNEELIAREKADWTIKIQMQRKEFLMREAKTYNETYKEIEEEVNYFCQANGIVMVLRFMGDPVDGENPDAILANINKPVVWYEKSLDITPYILKRFAGPAGPANTADRRNAPPSNGNPQPGGYAPPRASVPPSPFNGR